MTEARRNDAIALAVLAAIVTALFLDVLLRINTLFNSDIAWYYYPAKHVLRDIVLRGEFPSWNPWFAAGQPLAANPEHEVFYPLTWLILLPDYLTGFHLLMWIHLQIAGFTMYAFLRSLRIRAAAAFLGALSFAIGGTCLSYLNLLPILFSVAWLPLTLLYARRFLVDRQRRDFALAALFFGIQVVIGEPSTIAQTGILLGLFGIASGWKRDRWRGAATATALVGLLSLTALAVGAVQALPGADHAAHSVRARGFSFEQASDWSMPAVRVGEFLHPYLLGHNNLEGKRSLWAGSLYGKRNGPFVYSIYAGLLLAVLAIAGGFARVRGAGLALTVTIVSVLFALGGNTPLWRVLYDAGLVRSLRYPEKFILMAVVVVTVFGSRTLGELLDGNDRVRRAALRTAAVIGAIALALALFARTPWYATLFVRVWDPDVARVPEFLAAAAKGWWMTAVRAVIVLLLVRNALSARRAVWMSIATTFVVLDLASLMPEIAPRVPADYYSPPPITRAFPADRDSWRLFHHADLHKQKPQVRPYFAGHPDSMWVNRNGMFPMMPAQFGIRMALETDYDLTALLPTADFQQCVSELSDLRPDWVDVVASMSNVWYRAVFLDPREAFARAHGDRRLLQPVGILPLPHYPRYFFASAVESIRERRDFVRKVASGRYPRQTAFVPSRAFTPAAGRVLQVHETSNTAEIAVETQGTAFLVISVTPHKYWQLTIDGNEVPAVVTNVGYQGVVVPSAGRHVVRMRYRNPLIAAGAAVSLATLLALIGFAARAARMRAE